MGECYIIHNYIYIWLGLKVMKKANARTIDRGWARVWDRA